MSNSVKSVVSRATEIVNGADVDLIDEVFGEEFVEHNPMPGTDGDREGRKRSVLALRQGFPDFHMDVHRQIADGDLVVEHWTARGTHDGEFMGLAATGKTIEVEGIDISRVSDGRIAEHWTQMDTLGLLQQLGVLDQ